MKRFAAILGIWCPLVLAALVAQRAGSFAASSDATTEGAAVKPVVPHYRAVLAAGDDSIPNFDNAALAVANRLSRTGSDTTILTSDARLASKSRWYAQASVIEGVLSDTKPDEACLVFVTSHGNEYGLAMDLDDAEQDYLTPKRLAQILDKDCARRPTVAILSGCHTGTFLTPAMEADNRIILTAARKDRTSFGCSADYAFTYFDECFLEAMGDAGTWAAIFDRTKGCISKKEKAQDIEPSLPQAYFGSAVKDLGIE